MIHEQCESGITLRGLRRAFCSELRSNPDLVQIVGEAAGISRIESVTSVTMKGHGGDLTLICVVGQGETFSVGFKVHIDSLHGKGPLSRSHHPRWVKTKHEGEVRFVTIAPAIWFSHRGNAASAQNMILMSDLVDVASHDFWLALQQAETRAEIKFAEFAKPRPLRPTTALPVWVLRRLRRRW